MAGEFYDWQDHKKDSDEDEICSNIERFNKVEVRGHGQRCDSVNRAGRTRIDSPGEESGKRVEEEAGSESGIPAACSTANA
jgi:hypothetical protein